MKQIFLDLETTGSNYLKHGIYEIGGIIRYENILEEFELKCDIFQEDEINLTAFNPEKTNIKPEDLKTYPDPYETYQKLIAILTKHCDKFNKQDKFIFINFFASFDYDFLRRWFESNGDQYFGSFFWNPPLGLESLAMEYLINERHEMKNFQLTTVCRQLGIKVDENKTHSALYDAHLAKQLYDKIKKYG